MKHLRMILIVWILFTGCNKEDVPVVSTVGITSVKQTSATCGGEVISQGDSEITEKGICWSTSDNPTILDSIKVDDSGSNSYSSDLIKLNPNTEYFVRAYAINSFGTGYGKTKSFTTQPSSIPKLLTVWPYPIRCTSARSGGEITSDGASPVIDCGVCWNTSENPTLSDNFISAGAVLDLFRIWIPGLESNSEYYVRAYATNSVGTGYGNTEQFTTCLDINSNPVDPITITLWDKPLDTIRKYIEGKWRIVIIRGGAAGIDMCYNDFHIEFTTDDKFITNVYKTETDTFLIDWVEQIYEYSNTFRIELRRLSDGSKIASKYVVKELKNDSLIYHETWDDALYYYGIKEK